MRTATFRITRPGANHMHPEAPGSKKLKQYGYGDEIVLPADAGTDPKWNNLGLIQTGGSVHLDVAAEEAELGQEQTNPAVKPAPGDIGEPEGKSEDDAKLEALIAELEDSSGNAEFQAVRDKVIEADLFEADTVPTKKAELMQALIDLRDAE